MTAPETRTFPAPVVVALTTGFVLSTLDGVYDCASWILGRPTYTHDFADKHIQQRLRDAVLTACPAFAEADALVAGCNRDNWREKAAAVTARWPDGVVLPKGAGTGPSAAETLADLAAGKPVIRVEAP